MTTYRAVLLALAAMQAPPATAAAQAPTTIILVRHAEKAGDPADRDPELSEAGVRRASELARALGDANISAIYSTPFHRTRNTAAPLASRLGIEVTVTPIVRGFVQELAATLRREHQGQTVLVVGHSNTVPQTINALGAGPVEDLEEDQYDRLFVVSLTADGHASLVTLRFGAETR